MCSSPSAKAGAAHSSITADKAVVSFSDIFFSLGLLSASLVARSFGALPRDQERYRDEKDGNQQQDGRDGVDLGRHRPADLVPDIERQGRLAGAGDELGD